VKVINVKFQRWIKEVSLNEDEFVVLYKKSQDLVSLCGINNPYAKIDRFFILTDEADDDDKTGFNDHYTYQKYRKNHRIFENVFANLKVYHLHSFC
jgi:hypothetical protein